jgi:hypothetical protein
MHKVRFGACLYLYSAGMMHQIILKDIYETRKARGNQLAATVTRGKKEKWTGY